MVDKYRPRLGMVEIPLPEEIEEESQKSIFDLARVIGTSPEYRKLTEEDVDTIKKTFPTLAQHIKDLKRMPGFYEEFDRIEKERGW